MTRKNRTSAPALWVLLYKGLEPWRAETEDERNTHDKGSAGIEHSRGNNLDASQNHETCDINQDGSHHRGRHDRKDGGKTRDERQQRLE